MKGIFKALTLCFSLLFLYSNQSLAKTNSVNVSGAGPSAKIVQLFFSAFKTHNPKYKNIEFVVPSRSIKHAGGIRWSNKHLFGRTGRSLSDKEKAGSKKEILLAKIPAVFVKGKKVGIKQLTPKQLESIYNGKIINWKTLGGPNAKIELIGREPKEAIHSKLKKLYPFMTDAKYWITYTRDHQVIGHMNSSRSNYSLGYGAAPNFSKLLLMNITGPQTGVAVGLVYDEKNHRDALLNDVITFSQSKQWHDTVLKNDYLVVK